MDGGLLLKDAITFTMLYRSYVSIPMVRKLTLDGREENCRRNAV